MKNLKQNFLQTFIIFEKPGNFSKKLETLMSSNYPRVLYFFVEILHTFSTYQCLQKGKDKRDLASTH